MTSDAPAPIISTCPARMTAVTVKKLVWKVWKMTCVKALRRFYACGPNQASIKGPSATSFYSLAGMIIPTNSKIMKSDVFSLGSDHHLRAAC